MREFEKINCLLNLAFFSCFFCPVLIQNLEYYVKLENVYAQKKWKNISNIRGKSWQRF